MMAIEVHGQQHYEYSPFFHKTKAGFYQSLKRDEIKTEWCKLNNFNLDMWSGSDGEDIKKILKRIDKIKLSKDIKSSISNADVVFITVGTPERRINNGSIMNRNRTSSIPLPYA